MRPIGSLRTAGAQILQAIRASAGPQVRGATHPLHHLAGNGPVNAGSFLLIIVAAVVALVFHAAIYCPQAAFITEMFPTKVRYAGASMGYQLAGIVGGALAPIISVALLDHYDTSVAVSISSAAMLLVTLTCVGRPRNLRVNR